MRALAGRARFGVAPSSWQLAVSPPKQKHAACLPLTGLFDGEGHSRYFELLCHRADGVRQGPNDEDEHFNQHHEYYAADAVSRLDELHRCQIKDAAHTPGLNTRGANTHDDGQRGLWMQRLMMSRSGTLRSVVLALVSANPSAAHDLRETARERERKRELKREAACCAPQYSVLFSLLVFSVSAHLCEQSREAEDKSEVQVSHPQPAREVGIDWADVQQRRQSVQTHANKETGR